MPDGNYIVESIGPPNKRGKRIHIMAVHKSERDADKVAQALLAIVMDELHDRPDH